MQIANCKSAIEERRPPPLKAPFPYFGGKRRAAALVWQALGDVPVYCEPFFGSGAVLLARPHKPKVENVNDLDGYLANFWRAVQHDPAAVAGWCDWPVNEIDLEARHKWLVQADRKREHAARMKGDPDYYDAKMAGWWVWGLCSWIGSGWCAGEWHGDGSPDNAGRGINVRDPDRGGKLPHLGTGRGVHRKRPNLGNAGRGINRQRPHLGTAGQGVHRKLPHLGDAGQGVNRQRPHLGNAGQGACALHREHLVGYLRALSDRLRRTRICCGDWRRIVKSPTVTWKLGVCGIFLDPPYSDCGRRTEIYRLDSLSVAHDVRAWCLAHGDNPKLRIVLAGYDSEHRELSRAGWRTVKWKAHGGYGCQSNGNGSGLDYANCHRERLWLSPHCLPVVGSRGRRAAA